MLKLETVILPFFNTNLMILPFSTQFNGKPTYFVERIWKGLKENITDAQHLEILKQIPPSETIKQFEINAEAYKKVTAKLHTIRADDKNRWKRGTKIHFFINCRQPNMFRFAPILPVTSVQNIEIIWCSEVRSTELSTLSPKRLNYVDVIVDDTLLYIEDIKELSQNDGFDTVEEFFAYFNQDFTGKLIHWTDTRY